jgi:hypothetical protein
MVYSYDAAGNPIEQHTTFDERVLMAFKTIEEADLLMPVLVDQIDNHMWCSYGRRPNNAYLIDRDGKVILYQEWNDPIEMEAAIKCYLEVGQ